MAYTSANFDASSVTWDDVVWNNASAVVGPYTMRQDANVRMEPDGGISVCVNGKWTPLRLSTPQQPFPVPPPQQWRQAPIQQTQAPVTTQRVPHEAFFRSMLAGHKHDLAPDPMSGAVTVTHEDPTTPRSLDVMAIFDDNVWTNPSAGRALLAFLGRMHGNDAGNPPTHESPYTCGGRAEGHARAAVGGGPAAGYRVTAAGAVD